MNNNGKSTARRGEREGGGGGGRTIHMTETVLKSGQKNELLRSL